MKLPSSSLLLCGLYGVSFWSSARSKVSGGMKIHNKVYIYIYALYLVTL